MLFLKRFTFLLDLIFPPGAEELLVRSATFADLKMKCSPTKIQIENRTVTALLPYRAPLIQALITEAKYENNHKAQELLGMLLQDYIKVSKLPENIVCLPLPLGKTRRKERGYNQVEEIARYSGVAVATDVLVRVRETTPQTTLGKEARKLNMRGSFGVRTCIHPDQLYVLLDDVVTTGATLSAAAEALEKAGAQRLLILALAH